MKRILSRRPSPALVVACMSLFIALGGVSYGLATGSIDSREIKDNTLRAKDIRANSVTASEIKRRSLDGTDIKIERVGGNAVKEQVLEVGKLKQVPSAANANTLAGRGAAHYATRWALINESGAIERQTGGFSIVNCYARDANCYINAGEDVRDNGIHAQIAIATPIVSGETGTAPCGAVRLTCTPPGAENNNVLMVAPRESDGTPFGDGTGAPAPADAARFYVFVTGSEFAP